MPITTDFLAPIATQTVHFDLPEGDVSVSVFPYAGPTWRDHAAPYALEAAKKRRVHLRYKRRDAQASYGRMLSALVSDVIKDPRTEIPDDLRADVAECLEGRAIDEARRQHVKARVYAALAAQAEAA